MRIDVSQILGQVGMQVKPGTGTSTDSLKEGDVIKAEVLTNDRGSVTLKTENGSIFKARLDANAGLLPGDEVQLEVRGKDKGLALISASRDEAAINETSGRPGLTEVSLDKNLAQYLNKLIELNMPATKDTAQLMRELIAQNPRLSLDEAAFLASNKLTGDKALIQAALALLANGEKTHVMIARLLALLAKPEAGESGIRNSEFGIEGRASQPQGQSAVILPAQNTQLPASVAPLIASAANTAPLTDWLTLIASGAQGAAEALGQGSQGPAQTTQTIIAQSDTVLQSTNVENIQEIIQNNAENVQKQLEQLTTVLKNPSNTATPTPNTQLPESQSPVNPESLIQQPGVLTYNSTLHSSHSTLYSAHPTLHTQLAALLSELPEFRGTPASALERFSNMLLRVAGESANTSGGETEKLGVLLDKLFTKIGRSDTDAGARLKIAREELFARLALIEEAISRAAQPARMEMLEQTHRLMEHVRLLNNIEQFGYVQLPVQYGEERKTAELYIFKRKGGRRPDPENVNILLAIDLENLGRWEALMNIRSKDISIQMEVRGPAEKEHFSENTVLLHEMLDEAGFRLVSTAITYAEAETTPMSALSAMGRYTAGRAGAIDFTI